MDKVGTYINQYPYAHSTALFVHNYLLNGPKEIVLAAENDSDTLMEIVKQAYLPYKILASTSTKMNLPILKGKKMVNGKSAIYICKNYTCKEPIIEESVLRETLAL